MPHNHMPDPHSVALARCRQLDEVTDVSSLVEMDYDCEYEDILGKERKVQTNTLSAMALAVFSNAHFT